MSSTQRETMQDGKDIIVKTVSNYGFRLIDGTFLYGPVALFPRVALSWKVLTPDDICPESLELFGLLEPRLDLLLIGVGDYANVDKVRERVIPFLRKYKLPHEILATDDAVALFNYLNQENRHLAACLYPPDELKLTERQRLQAVHEMLEDDMFDVDSFGPRLTELDPKAKRMMEGPKEAESYYKFGDEAKSFIREETDDFLPMSDQEKLEADRKILLDRQKKMLREAKSSKESKKIGGDIDGDKSSTSFQSYEHFKNVSVFDPKKRTDKRNILEVLITLERHGRFICKLACEYT